MGTCLIFGDAPVRERLTGHLTPVFDDLRCVDDLPSLVGRMAQCVPDLVLVGADRGSAWLEALRVTAQRHPAVPVVVVGGFEDELADPATFEELATRALGLGARGFLRIGHLADPRGLPGAGRSRTELSQREMDVLLGMTEGLSNAEIAVELVLAEDTVKTHARRLFRKLGAGDRADAVARGFRQGLLR